MSMLQSMGKHTFYCMNDYVAAAAAQSLQLCPTLCDPIDLPGSPVPGILQARTLEWVAISFSNAWKWKVKVKMKVNLFSHVRLLATPRTTAYQAPLPMGFSRREYWSGVPLPSPNDYVTGLKICCLNRTTLSSIVNIFILLDYHKEIMYGTHRNTLK